MTQEELKSVFFIAVTNNSNGNNKKYSNFVYEMCYHEIKNDSRLSRLIDLNKFKRHDMEDAGNIKNSLYKCLTTRGVYIVLLDMHDERYNPNVWFELGAISTSDKRIILIAKYHLM